VKLAVSSCAEAELRALVSVQPGDVFSRQAVTDSSKRIGDRLGNEGYAFANVNAVPDIDRQSGKVAFTFFVDPGRRCTCGASISPATWPPTTSAAARDAQLEARGSRPRRCSARASGCCAWGCSMTSTSKPRRCRAPRPGRHRRDRQGAHGQPVHGRHRLLGCRCALVNASVNFKNLVGTGKELQLSGDNSASTAT